MSPVDLPRGQRTDKHVLDALRKSPCLDIWQIRETPWLCRAIERLEAKGLLCRVRCQFPVVQFLVKEVGQ